MEGDTSAKNENDPQSRTDSIKVASVSDQPTLADTLGFQPYVQAIVKFLSSVDTKPPLTLSIEGEWGSGKSSFMIQLQQELNASPVSEVPDGSKNHEATLQLFLQWIVTALRGPPVMTVQFNAWRHDKEDSLWAAFALQFLRGIANQRSMIPRWLGHIKLFLKRYRWQDGWFDMLRAVAVWFFLIVLVVTIPYAVIAGKPKWATDLVTKFVDSSEKKDSASNTLILSGLIQAGGVAGYLALVVTAVQIAKKLVGNPLEINLRKHLRAQDYEGRVAFVEQFHEDFQRIVDCYAGKRKVYVLIDDVDRCEVPKAAELMQALNLLISDDPRLIFVIGMDREKVAAGFAVKYDKLLPYLSPDRLNGAPEDASSKKREGLSFGFAFIEKFIQLPFRVPMPDSNQIEQFLRAISGPAAKPERTSNDSIEPLEVSIASDSQELQNVTLMVAPTLDNNPRRIKQFINVFRLKAYIAYETGLLEGTSPTTLTQLGKFVALGLKWPSLLTDLAEDPELLQKLQMAALDKLPEGKRGPLVNFWNEQHNLRALLQYGCVEEKKPGAKYDPKRYSLEKLNVQKLLETSPRTKRIQPEHRDSINYNRRNPPEKIASAPAT